MQFRPAFLDGAVYDASARLLLVALFPFSAHDKVVNHDLALAHQCLALFSKSILKQTSATTARPTFQRHWPKLGTGGRPA